MELITTEIKEEEEKNLVMREDYNARMGNEEGPVRGEEGNVRETRKSVDKVVNRGGKLLVNKIEDRRWMILNRSYDIEGGWTYVGEAGTSVNRLCDS